MTTIVIYVDSRISSTRSERALAAYRLAVNDDSATPIVSVSVPLPPLSGQWLFATYDNGRLVVRPLAERTPDNTTDDFVILCAETADITHNFTAGGGRDTYIIGIGFSSVAAAGMDTNVTITDTGANTFIFREDVEISSIHVNEDGGLEISFGSNSHKALIIENAAEASFKFGRNGDDKTLNELKAIIGTPSTAAPYVVVEIMNKPPTPSAEPIPVIVVNPGDAWNYQIPEFTDPDNDPITYTATRADGTALPGWLSFDADSHTFNIEDGAANISGLYEIKMTASAIGGSNSVVFTIVVPSTETVFVEYPDADKSVILNTETPADTDLYAEGRLVITDSHGLGFVFPSNGRFGVLTLTRDGTRPGLYDWGYRLNKLDPDVARLEAQSLQEIVTITVTDANNQLATYDLVINARGVGRIADTLIKDGAGQATLLIHGVEFKVAQAAEAGNAIWIDFVTRDRHGAIITRGGVPRDNSPEQDSPQNGYDFRFTPDAIITPSMLKNIWDSYTGTHASNTPSARTERITAEIVNANLKGISAQKLLGRYWFKGGADPHDHYKDPATEVLLDDKAVTLDHIDSGHNDFTAMGRLALTDERGIGTVVPSSVRYGKFTITFPTSGAGYLWKYRLNPHDADTAALGPGAAHEIITLIIEDRPRHTTTHHITIDITVVGVPDIPAVFTESTGDSNAPDKSVTLNHNDESQNDTHAGGVITITDSQGINAANVTASAGVYGTATITEDSTTPGNYIWEYRLDPDDAEVADLEADMNEVITIRAVDNIGHAATYALVITINVVGVPNVPPTAAARPVTLDEEAAHIFTIADFGFADADGDELASVMIAALPVSGMLTLNGAAVTAGQEIEAHDITAGHLVYTPPLGLAMDTKASFTYTVSDGTLHSAPAVPMTITIKADDDAPVFALNTPTTANLAENTDATKAAVYIATITAADPEGDAITYGLAKVTPDIPGFAIDANGMITYRGAELDHEGQPTYKLKITATANGKTATHIVQINITDIDEAPSFAPSFATTFAPSVASRKPLTARIAENADGSQVAIDIITVKAVDPDASDSITYGLDKASISTGFVMNPITGHITYEGTGLDHEMQDTYSLTIIATSSNSVSGSVIHRVIVAITDVNEAPTATPLAQSTDEETPITFVMGDFGFMDADDGAMLAAITIVSLPDRGKLLFNGVAVKANQVIEAAHIGGLTYRPDESGVADYNTSLTYRVDDGTLSSPAATMDIDVAADDDGVAFRIRDEIGITIDRDIGEAIGGVHSRGAVHILTPHQVGVLDPDTAGVDTSAAQFTLMAITGGVVQVYDRGEWADVTPGNTQGSGVFTQQNIDDGHVRLIATETGSLSVTAAHDGRDFPPQTLRFVERVQHKIKAVEIGGTGLDMTTGSSDENAIPRVITTGLGTTAIKPGTGDDIIDPGPGDDAVDLTPGGDDVVVYRYATDDDGNTIAWGGGDDIRGFTPGQDRILVDHIGGDNNIGGGGNDIGGNNNIGGGGRASFLDGLGGGFVATLMTAYGGAGDRGALANYDIKGIEIHFMEAVVLPGGVLGGSILSIEFDKDSVSRWGDFKTDWLDDGGFDAVNLLFSDNAAGRASLTRILGLGEAGVDAPRPVAVGGTGDDTIDLTGKGGAWVILGGLGDDVITLASGTPPVDTIPPVGVIPLTGGTPPADTTPPPGGTPPADETPPTNTAKEVIYRLGIDDDTDAISTHDGSDVVHHFALGVDRLTFVDTHGVPPAPTPDASAVDRLMAILGDSGAVSFAFNATDQTYTGMVFEIVGAGTTATLRINFAAALSGDGLAGRLGFADAGALDDGGIFADVDGTVAVVGGVPTVAGNAALSTAGLALIDQFFGDGTISVEDSLPPELL